MNGIWLLTPLLLIRFGLLSLINKDALKRASHFSPMSGKEILAYWIYQFSNIAIFVYSFFVFVTVEYSLLFYIGLMIYVIGILLFAISTINFARPSTERFQYNGLYRFSRNPMYHILFILQAVLC